jgi:hypothetical protein
VERRDNTRQGTRMNGRRRDEIKWEQKFWKRQSTRNRCNESGNRLDQFHILICFGFFKNISTQVITNLCFFLGSLLSSTALVPVLDNNDPKKSRCDSKWTCSWLGLKRPGIHPNGWEEMAKGRLICYAPNDSGRVTVYCALF